MQRQPVTLPPGLWREALWRWAYRGRRLPDFPRDLAFYEHQPHNADLIREMIRLENLHRRMRQLSGTVPPMWLPDQREPWKIPLDIQVALDRLPPPGPPAPAQRAWETAARGWGAALVLLAVVLMLIRLSEKCFDIGLFKARRRRSVEWPTPNVLATSHRPQDMTDEDLDALDPYQDHATVTQLSVDLPPPYSACASSNPGPNAGSNTGPKFIDEPPPPYSACYVAFSNPKDGVPSVQFLNSERQNVLDESRTSTLVLDTGQTSEGTNEEGNRGENSEELRREGDTVRELTEGLNQLTDGLRDLTDGLNEEVAVTNPGNVASNSTAGESNVEEHRRSVAV
ncbi:hypothetical protein JYU34_020735 [Plutella xylostella]|uniref:Uncharacterized protein n=1 Tax=Plutella xylostella TaxID=51655 RepID=A0ABQ7PV93_PLUXY|nr:hypothetical protein JYU34_020735 [Plutella xylostella]